MNKFLLHIATFLIALPAFSQNSQSFGNSLMEQKQTIENSTWLKTKNSSSLLTDSLPEFNNFDIYYKLDKLNFAPTKQANKSHNFGFNTYGIKKLKKLFLSGNMQYMHSTEENINWYLRYQPDEPNPFYIADSIGGEWTKNSINTSFSISPAKTLKGFIPSIKANYNVGMGGRNNDPRPKSRWREITAYPSITYKNKDGLHLGITATLSTKLEDIDIINKSGIGGNTIYKINGLTLLSSPTVETALSYQFNSFTKGGAFLIGKAKNNKKFISELQYSNTIEDAIESPYSAYNDDETSQITPLVIKDLSFNQDLIKALFFYSTKRSTNTISYTASALYCIGKTYNHHTEEVDYKQQKLLIHAKANFFIYKKPKFKYFFRIKVDYSEYSCKNYFYASQKISSLSPIVHAGFIKSINRFKLETDITSKYNTILNKYINIYPQSPTIPVQTDITQPVVFNNYNFFSSNYSTLGISTTIYLPSKSIYTPYIKCSYHANIYNSTQNINYIVLLCSGIVF